MNFILITECAFKRVHRICLYKIAKLHIILKVSTFVLCVHCLVSLPALPQSRTAVLAKVGQNRF